MRALFTIGLVLALGTSALHKSRAQSMSQADFAQYRDEQFRFSIHYPRTWAKVDPSHTSTRFKAVSDGGFGEDDLSVVVTTVPGSGNVTPEEFIKSINPQAYLAFMRHNVPNAKLIEHGQTTLSNQAAYYYVVDVTYQILGGDVPMRMYQVQTAKGQAVYSITFRTDQGQNPEGLELFKQIAAGFVLWPEAPNGMTEKSVESRGAASDDTGPAFWLTTILVVALFVLGMLAARRVLTRKPQVFNQPKDAERGNEANPRQKASPKQVLTQESEFSVGQEIQVHVIDPEAEPRDLFNQEGSGDGSMYRTEKWVVGENISVEQCEKFFDKKSQALYALTQYDKDGNRGFYAVRKDLWDQTRSAMDNM